MSVYPVTPGRQRGMALLVSLVFLLLLTLIGISSMQNANLQEKMANSINLLLPQLIARGIDDGRHGAHARRASRPGR